MPRVKKMTERWECMAESSVSMPHTYFASSLAPCTALNFERSISNERALPIGLLHSRFQSSVNKMLRKRLISSFESPIPFSR